MGAICRRKEMKVRDQSRSGRKIDGLSLPWIEAEERANEEACAWKRTLLQCPTHESDDATQTILFFWDKRKP